MFLPNLLSLPPAIIALLCAAPIVAAEQLPTWPHNIPKHLKYFPEDEGHARRGISIQEKLRYEKPIGIKKMGLDESEMFMMDNWIFASDSTPALHAREDTDTEDLGNGTCRARSAFRPIAHNDLFERMHIRDVLLRRQFKCPEDTNSCEAIGAPDVCCGTGSTCINVDGNNDAGSVGCCPQGANCAGSVSCDEANGYSSCPNAPNGGCCLPGFSCQGIGCVFQETSITYVQPSTSTSTTSSPSSSTAVIVVPTSPSTTSAEQTSPTTSPYTCSTGWFSCAASLGGGCCQNGRTCATGASCLGGPEPTTTQAPSAPVRPTSGSESTAPTTTDDSSQPSDDVCPQGFYVCSAYYPSGCCRVGRDCQTTGSCVLPSSTIVDTNGVVIVAPTGADVASTTAAGSCPSAWFSCAADRGGDCCPEGYACGERECTATATGASGTTGKVEPETSEAVVVELLGLWSVGIVALACGIAMVVL